MRSLKWLRNPIALALLTSAISLVIWAALGIGANFGVSPVLSAVGLIWLATAGLPTSIGVVVAATVWGRSESISGLPGFLVLATALGLTFQVVTFAALGRKAASARAKDRPRKIGRALPAAGVGAVLVSVTLCATYRPAAAPDVVIDGHAHLFGDEGWPPVHKRTCGLSPAQKANPTYGLLNRLLHLPATGDLNELYLQAMVRQVEEARRVLGDFRVVLLAQDCRYDEAGEPDWIHTSVYVPNEHLFRVLNRYPDFFIPCPSINPQRKDWEAELDYCLAQGARVLKIHPPTQAVNPADPRFRAFYRKCAAGGMRIMVHTGAEHSAPIASDSSLGDPRLLELALGEGCTVIAAHAGTKAFFDPPAEDHFPFLVGMMARHPRLYADTAVLGSQFRWRCLPEIVHTPGAQPRMLHASDWPFPSNAMVFWHRLHPFTLIELMAEKNLLVRDFRLKQALGMPTEAFSQMSKIIPVESTASARRGGAAVVPYDPATSPSYEFTKRFHAQAIEAGDREVAAAANYNLLHLQTVAMDEAMARPALEELAKTGDEFTLRWLESPAHLAIPPAHQPLVARTEAQIRVRLNLPLEPPDNQAIAWLLRSAVSDLTCNHLEGQLGRFRFAWVEQHRHDPGVKEQLEAVAAANVTDTAKAFSPASVRIRARSYSASALSRLQRPVEAPLQGEEGGKPRDP